MIKFTMASAIYVSGAFLTSAYVYNISKCNEHPHHRAWEAAGKKGTPKDVCDGQSLMAGVWWPGYWAWKGSLALTKPIAIGTKDGTEQN